MVFTQWSTLTLYPTDPLDSSGDNNFIDWQRAGTAHNASSVYFLYQNTGAVDPSNNNGDYISWGWQTYLDTDNNSSTGYQVGDIGADYILEGTNLQTYSGSGSDWSWSNYTAVNVKYSDNNVELSFDRNLITNPNEFSVLFVGNNAPSNGDSIDNYPDNLQAFRYQLTGGSLTVANRPVAENMMVEVAQNSNTNFNLLASDIDNDQLSYRLLSAPSNGSLSDFNTNGNAIEYTPNTDFVGEDSFRYIANDGTYDSSVNTVIIRVSESSDTVSSTTENQSGGGSNSILMSVVLALIYLLKIIITFNMRYRRSNTYRFYSYL